MEWIFHYHDLRWLSPTENRSTLLSVALPDVACSFMELPVDVLSYLSPSHDLLAIIPSQLPLWPEI